MKEVVYPVDLMNTMTHTIRVTSTALLIVAGLFIFVSFVLISNTMGLLIHTRRFSIRTMKLVGPNGVSSAVRSCCAACASPLFRPSWREAP